MKKIITSLFVLAFTWASASYAGNMISVTVVADKSITSQMRVFGIGFSVNGKSKGSPGSSTTKMGPAGATYSFGFRIAGRDVDCGKAVLRNNSKVVLSFSGGRCTNSVMSK